MKNIFFLTLLFPATFLAQEEEHPLRMDASQFVRAQTERSFGISSSERGGSLSLPFFDDFSRYSLPTADPGIPDEWQMWTDNDASINSNMPVSPPTIGVATLDGLNDCGMPYDWTGNDNYGPADTLTSKPIDLSGYTAEDNVFLMFYYEAGGHGNSPDPEDSLVLELYSPFGAGEWFHTWSVPGTDLVEFQRVALSIVAPEYLMDGFRFRFRNYATLSGNMDHWHLDYVVMDTGIPAEVCEDFNEVAMEYPLNTLLTNSYTAMPWTHFTPNPSAYMLPSFSFTQHNLGPTENIASGWSVSYDGAIIENNPAVNINTFNNGCQEIAGTMDVDGFSFAASGNDSCASFDVKVYFNPTDGHLQNDTTTFTQHLLNYYAYDDGTAERAYALNTAGAQLAVRYFSEEPDSLIGLLIHWTPFETDNSTETFFLRAWGDGGGQPGSEMGENFTFHSPQYFCDGSDIFAYYAYDEPLFVDGTFYAGWVQQSNAELNVGNDKNTDTNPTHLFYQLGFGGEWLQSAISGSVMIRPVLRSGKPDFVQVAETRTPGFKIYPNPAQDQVYISSGHSGGFQIQVLDVTGRMVLSEQTTNEHMTLDISHWQSGTYLIRIVADGYLQTERLVKY